MAVNDKYMNIYVRFVHTYQFLVRIKVNKTITWRKAMVVHPY
jgi:hypothetical protein